MLKALYEQDLFPRVLAGSSVGALVAALVASQKYSELYKFFTEQRYLDGTHPSCLHLLEHKFKTYWEAIQMVKEGKHILLGKTIGDRAREFLGDLTFQEIYDKNKWTLNITVTTSGRFAESKLLNYMTTPNMVVWSAVQASCSIPGMIEPC